MKRVIVGLCIFLLNSLPAASEQPVALVTDISGKLTQEGRALELLQYLRTDEPIQVEAGGQATFSYVEGGVRVTAKGPCILVLRTDGPTLTEGSANLMQIFRPTKRVGVALPTHLDLGTGGHLRRGELALHLPRRILPGALSVPFTALPSFKNFTLTVSNSSTYQEVFQKDQAGAESFVIPADILKSGQSYDFLLQGTSDSGQTLEVEQTAVLVLSEEVASQLETARSSNSTFADKTELLAYYLKHGIDDQALEITEDLLKTDEQNRKLLKLRKTLKERLGYS